MLASYKFESQTATTLRREPGEIGGQAFDLSNIKDSTVLLLDNCDQVQVDNLTNCKVFIGPASGSIFIRNCHKCTFTMACKQLRTRDCSDCTISLFVVGDPIIETSTAMRFAPFNGEYSQLQAQFDRARFDRSANKWDRVYDFNDEGKTGENWSIMPECERPVAWAVETDAAAGASAGGVAGALRVGMDVHCRFGGGPRWFPATVATVGASTSGTFSIDFRDGDHEDEVPRRRIRLPGDKEPDTVAVGADVDARYAGGALLFLATVSKMNEDGTYDLDYADGDKEAAVQRKHLFACCVSPNDDDLEARMQNLLSRMMKIDTWLVKTDTRLFLANEKVKALESGAALSKDQETAKWQRPDWLPPSGKAKAPGQA